MFAFFEMWCRAPCCHTSATPPAVSRPVRKSKEKAEKSKTANNGAASHAIQSSSRQCVAARQTRDAHAQHSLH